MAEPFKGPKLKVGRGKHHFEDLRGALARHKASRPFKLAVREDGDLDIYTVKADPIPGDIPLIVGDAVHNIRTALDLLAGDLVTLNGHSRKKVRFPFCKFEHDFDAILKRAGFDKAAPDVVNLVKGLAPWKGALRALHELDLADKHEMVLPASIVLSGRLFEMLLTLETTEMSLGMSSQGAPEDNTVAEDALNASFKLIFPPAHIGQTNPGEVEIAPKLHEFAELVEGIIQTFEAHCF